MGTELSFRTAFHFPANGQSERVIKILEDLIRCCALDFGGSWSEHLPLVEFSYNNNYQASIGMAPYEALYGRPCRSSLCWAEAEERLALRPELRLLIKSRLSATVFDSHKVAKIIMTIQEGDP